MPGGCFGGKPSSENAPKTGVKVLGDQGGSKEETLESLGRRKCRDRVTKVHRFALLAALITSATASTKSPSVTSRTV